MTYGSTLLRARAVAVTVCSVTWEEKVEEVIGGLYF